MFAGLTGYEPDAETLVEGAGGLSEFVNSCGDIVPSVTHVPVHVSIAVSPLRIEGGSTVKTAVAAGRDSNCTVTLAGCPFPLVAVAVARLITDVFRVATRESRVGSPFVVWVASS